MRRRIRLHQSFEHCKCGGGSASAFKRAMVKVRIAGVNEPAVTIAHDHCRVPVAVTVRVPVLAGEGEGEADVVTVRVPVLVTSDVPLPVAV